MTTPVDPIDTTSLAPGNYTKTIILNDIFEIIQRMLVSIQSVATAQADRLQFLTQWQKAYTDLMAQVKVFVKGDPAVNTAISNDDTIRGDLNRLNSQYTTTLQNKQSVISDDSKSLQSNINQSNDAVNQQSTMATSILQELSTILSSIFR